MSKPCAAKSFIDWLILRCGAHTTRKVNKRVPDGRSGAENPNCLGPGRTCVRAFHCPPRPYARPPARLIRNVSNGKQNHDGWDLGRACVCAFHCPYHYPPPAFDTTGSKIFPFRTGLDGSDNQDRRERSSACTRKWGREAGEDLNGSHRTPPCPRQRKCGPCPASSTCLTSPLSSSTVESISETLWSKAFRNTRGSQTKSLRLIKARLAPTQTFPVK